MVKITEQNKWIKTEIQTKTLKPQTMMALIATRKITFSGKCLGSYLCFIFERIVDCPLCITRIMLYLRETFQMWCC